MSECVIECEGDIGMQKSRVLKLMKCVAKIKTKQNDTLRNKLLQHKVNEQIQYS